MSVGDPEDVLTDAGSCFSSPYFDSACKFHSITLRRANAEIHISLGKGETYHNELRNMFMKLHSEYPTAPRAQLLLLSVFAMNTSVNEHGLILVVLVFGMLLRLPDLPRSGPLPQDERINMLRAARVEFVQTVTERRT